MEGSIINNSKTEKIKERDLRGEKRIRSRPEDIFLKTRRDLVRKGSSSFLRGQREK
jgi:hypothetical protein